MKAVGVLCSSESPSTNAGVSSGRVAKQPRHNHHNRDVENEEVQMYLSKLRDLVPFMPRGRKLSKLEVIQNVIDYICDLQSALEAHPQTVVSQVNGAFDAAAVLRGSSPVVVQQQQSPSTRQPLGVRSSPNTILTTNVEQHITNPPSSSSSSTTALQQPHDKQQHSPSPPDGRALSSC